MTPIKMKEITFENPKSYATRANLERALKKVEDVGTHDGKGVPRYMVCQTPEGRYFAVFIGANNFHFVHYGFCVVS